MISQPPPIGTWLRPVTSHRLGYIYRLERILPADDDDDADQWWLRVHTVDHQGTLIGDRHGLEYISHITAKIGPDAWRLENWGYEGRAIFLDTVYLRRIAHPTSQMELL